MMLAADEYDQRGNNMHIVAGTTAGVVVVVITTTIMRSAECMYSFVCEYVHVCVCAYAVRALAKGDRPFARHCH